MAIGAKQRLGERYNRYLARRSGIRGRSPNRYNPNEPNWYEVHGVIPPLAFLNIPRMPFAEEEQKPITILLPPGAE